MTTEKKDKVSRDTFERNLSHKSVEELRRLESLKSAPETATKQELIDLAWSVYSGEKPAEIKVPEPGSIVEGRVADDRAQFRRGGYQFGREWKVLDPTPTAEQIDILKAEKAIRIRVK
jgi:hypothetical protein